MIGRLVGLVCFEAWQPNVSCFAMFGDAADLGVKRTLLVILVALLENLGLRNLQGLQGLPCYKSSLLRLGSLVVWMMGRLVCLVCSEPWQSKS